MPELPEMETYKKLLQDLMAGKNITGVEINRDQSINTPAGQFIKEVTGRRVVSVQRRAKYLMFHLENGNSLLLHLMLGGWMFFGKEEDRPDRTVQVKLTFTDQHLYFIGLRLGYLYLMIKSEMDKELQHLGPDPSDPHFSLSAFRQRVENRRGTLKAILVNQEIVSGIGNRYSDEILWSAELRPERKIMELGEAEMRRLFDAMKETLKQGIYHGGYMNEPLLKGDNRIGNYHMRVHGLEGKPCPRCSKPIMMTKLSSHKTFYCSNCQH